jgi:hypothetical protein
MGSPDRLCRVWLAVLSVFVLLQTPLMTHKLAMACAAAADALVGARESRREIQTLREQMRAGQQDQQRDPIVLQTSLEPITGPISGPR